MRGLLLWCGLVLAAFTACRAPPDVAGEDAAPTPPVVWPNDDSRANSDPWLIEHHDEIDVMRPRILVLDFVNGEPLDRAHALATRTVDALVESSRPRGYAHPDAPAAFDPELLPIVDLRDSDSGARANSTLYPREEPVEGYWGFDYEELFSDAFAIHMDLRDPARPDDGPLTLCAAIDRGLVHEVWIYGDGDTPDVSAAEILEQKPVTDLDGRPTGAMNRCAGNGCFDDEDEIACPRTVRIGWFTNAAFSDYSQLANDCMGPFLVWWRQNWPGPHTDKIAPDGHAMRNWWPYLYY